MRKVISLFLAVAVLCLSTSAMAAPTAGTVSGMRKSTNNTLQGSESSTSSMPCFRPGDTISFSVGSVVSGEELTVISYKNGETPDDTTVQYINQYTLSSSSQSISYTIRNLDSGVYMLKFTGSTSGSATFYYKIGNATVQVLDNDDKDGNGKGTFVTGYGDPYIMKQMDGVGGTWSIGFIGKVTVDSADVTLSDIGATPGFEITNGSKTHSYGFGQTGQKTVANLESVTGNAKLEISGSYSFIYGLTLYDVPNGTENSYTAQAVVDVQ